MEETDRYVGLDDSPDVRRSAVGRETSCQRQDGAGVEDLLAGQTDDQVQAYLGVNLDTIGSDREACMGEDVSACSDEIAHSSAGVTEQTCVDFGRSAKQTAEAASSKKVWLGRRR